MEKRIKDRYNDAILQEAMRRYGIAPDRIRLLDGFESFIYEFERGGRPFILRIGHTFRRSENLIHGEADWIHPLGSAGASWGGCTPSRRTTRRPTPRGGGRSGTIPRCSMSSGSCRPVRRA